MTGLEVEAVDTVGSQFDGVVIGAVTAVVKHPAADRLSVCTVDLGLERVEIVCGAPNVAAGQRVPVARVGALLPGGMGIKKSKIRGVVSHGMICSEAELGLSDEADGIMVLDPGAPVGASFDTMFGRSETVLSINVGTNRPDCLALTGIAREITAMTRKALRMPPAEVTEAGPAIDDLASVAIADYADCPRFVGRVITGVRIAPSSEWMIRRLESVGIRAINNVVDVTNYVMIELGQPLHAYDLDTLAGHEINVRRAREGATFTTLDGEERPLSAEVLMIADRDREIGVAGVMGGLNTEITEHTTRVFLEGACFDATRVRRGSKYLGLETDASRRFERGMDPELQGRAVARAAQMIAELAGGTLATGMIDVRAPATPSPSVRLRVDRVNALLGTAVSREDMSRYFHALGFSVRQEDDLVVDIPSFRRDITREADLAEEVARLYGYDRIQPTMSSPTPLRLEETQGVARRQREMRQRSKEYTSEHLRESLIGCGFIEVMTHSFAHPSDLKKIQPSHEPVILNNPLSIDLSAMRTTLIVPVLGVVRWNSNRKVRDIRVFEIGRIFVPNSVERLPDEPMQLCFAMTGTRAPVHWSSPPEPVDFFDVKGIAETTLGRFALDNVRSVPYDGELQAFDTDRSAALTVNGEQIGAYGAVSQAVLDHFDIKEPVWLCILDLNDLIQLESTRRTYFTLPKYPAVERDLAVVVPEHVSHQEIVEVIRERCDALLEAIDLFDVYRGQQVPAGKKSMAYALRYRSSERTLTDDEVSSLQAGAIGRLGELYGAELR